MLVCFVLLTVASSAFGGLPDFNCGSVPSLAHHNGDPLIIGLIQNFCLLFFSVIAGNEGNWGLQTEYRIH